MEEKVKQIEQVFKELDEQIAVFKNHSGLQCGAGCGKCCFKPDIEASVLEFIPFAFYLYQQNLASEWLEKLTASTSSLCLILNPVQRGAGLCSEYTYRGLICRLFGYSARTNKYGKKELITCQIIKTEQEPNYKQAQNDIEVGLVNAPVTTSYYMKLHSIDPVLASEFLSINKAIRRALEEVLHYYAYRTFGII
jgi:uncharacterized protein